MVKNGDSTGVTVTRYDHISNPKQKVYYVVRGTYDGSYFEELYGKCR